MSCFQLPIPKKLVLALTSLTIVLALCECGQRISNWRKARKREQSPYSWRAETALGRRIGDKPGVLVLRHDPHLIIRARESTRLQGLTINNRGFRGADWTREKPPGTKRVAVLGGSTAFGLLAKHDDQTITAFLEDRLRELPRLREDGMRVEVWNAGMIAYTSTQELVLLATELVDHELDAVVLLDGFNDMTSGAGGGGPDRIGLSHPLFMEMDRVLGQASEHGLNLFRGFAFTRGLERRIRRLERGDRTPDHDAAVGRYRRNLVQICRIVHANGAEAVLCPQPEVFQRGGSIPALEQGIREDAPSRYKRLATETYPIYVDAARRVAESEGATFVDGRRAFDGSADHAFRDRVHLTERGNELVAELLVAPAARALGLMPPRDR